MRGRHERCTGREDYHCEYRSVGGAIILRLIRKYGAEAYRMKLSDSKHRSVGSSSEHDDELTGCIKGEGFKGLEKHVDVSKNTSAK